ncbi:VanZ family protein [Alkalicoccus luteus]|uniref:VanZ-like domain-containing protein n=1 Tax=Alkalicoccus luteus TaxID=1237094 RepID=A0A969TXM0_9BACI|nr:VanZ family protein [Alkalicoccus luteus]NJP38349.1 hypothetical protein [Alkalicoccus luteus]
MRGIYFFIWLALFLIGMWTESSTRLIYDQHVAFTLTRNVSWENFWSTDYVEALRHSGGLLVSKVAHVVSSFLLGLLFFRWIGLKLDALVCLLLGVAVVEVLQEFFTREAYALDIMLNATGVLTAALLVSLWQVETGRAIEDTD